MALSNDLEVLIFILNESEYRFCFVFILFCRYGGLSSLPSFLSSSLPVLASLLLIKPPNSPIDRSKKRLSFSFFLSIFIGDDGDVHSNAAAILAGLAQVPGVYFSSAVVQRPRPVRERLQRLARLPLALGLLVLERNDLQRANRRRNRGLKGAEGCAPRGCERLERREARW